jgi:peptidyl-prolyl cis-trans isomerase A (cyclophilin A)
MKTFVLLLTAAVCAAGQAPVKAPAKAPSSKAAAARKPALRRNPALRNPALARATAPELYKVRLATTQGDIIIEVHRDWAPLGADRFYNLVKIGYYDGNAFFRYVPGFVVQWGLHPEPAVNAVWSKATIKDEPVKQSNRRGTVAFAMTSEPNTRNTQLYINFRDNAQLDPKGFAPIGSVVEGLEVAEKLYAGYGQSPDQEQMASAGQAYLEKNFPRLDKINAATVIFPAPAAPPARKAASRQAGAKAAPANQ